MSGDERLGAGLGGLREDEEPMIEGLFAEAHEAKLSVIFEQDGEARRRLARKGLEEVLDKVASLAAWEELEREHLENARRIAREHGVDLYSLGKKVAARLEREGFGERAERIVRELELSSVPEHDAAAAEEIKLGVALLEINEQYSQRAAIIACERFLHQGEVERFIELARRQEVLERFEERLEAEIVHLMRPHGERGQVFDGEDIERAAKLAAAAGLKKQFALRIQQVAAQALVGAAIRGASKEVSAAELAWRHAGVEQEQLRALSVVGIMLTVVPPGTRDEVLGLAEERGTLADDEVLLLARTSLERYIEREASPRALTELAKLARAHGEGHLAWRAAERACQRTMVIQQELQAPEAAEELALCLELLEGFDVSGTRSEEVVAAYIERLAEIDHHRAAEVAKAQGLAEQMRVQAEAAVREQLEALELDEAAETARDFELRPEQVETILRDVVLQKIADQELLDALSLASARGVAKEDAREGAKSWIGGLGEDAHHDDLELALEVAREAGLVEQQRDIARRIFMHRYQFSKMLSSYAFLLESLRFARAHEVDERCEDFDEGLSRILAFQASRDRLDLFDEVMGELDLDSSRVAEVVDDYLERIVVERAPWFEAVERVARRYDRVSWLEEQATALITNAIVYGDPGDAAEFARRMGDERLLNVVERAAAFLS